MKLFYSLSSEVAELLKKGAIGVVRTDTIYGIVARADCEAAVKRIYTLKGRDDTKSPIVLISNLDQMFELPSKAVTSYLASVWPGKKSIIVKSDNAPTWISRGNNSVAYRMPDLPELQGLLNITGPLIAPSANPQGMATAQTIDEAQNYFGSGIDFYVNQGRVTDNIPSELLRLYEDGLVERLR